MTTTDQTTAISRKPQSPGWRRRLTATMLGGALLGGVLVTGVGRAEAADPPAPKLVPTLGFTLQPTDPHPGGLRIQLRAAISSDEPMTGVLRVSLYKPVAATVADPCGGSAFQSTTNLLTLQKQGGTDLFYTLKSTDPDGVWHWKATFPGDAKHEAVSTGCAGAFVVKPDPGPVKPGDPDPGVPGSVRSLVNRQYQSMLGRAATQSELDYWSTLIAAGDSTIGDVVANLRGTDDHQEHVDPAVRLYSAYFLRTPDAAGLDYWISQLRGGKSLIWVSDFFSQSPEFQRRYGSLTNEGFVDLIYKNILGRGGDQNGIDFWNDQLDRGLRSRGDVMVGFSESPEYKKEMASEVHVAVLYALLLDRAPTTSELEGTVDLLDITDTPLPFTVADLADDLLAD